MKEWLIAFKQVLLHPFNILNAFFDNDAHKIVSKRGLKLLNKNYNMTPKEKARDLIIKFAFKGAQHEGEAKTFALIAVDEIEKALTDYGSVDSFQRIILDAEFRYWDKVKMEINNL